MVRELYQGLEKYGQLVSVVRYQEALGKIESADALQLLVPNLADREAYEAYLTMHMPPDLNATMMMVSRSKLGEATEALKLRIINRFPELRDEISEMSNRSR